MREKLYIKLDTILKLNEFIQNSRADFSYHMHHIQAAREYALILREKLGTEITPDKLSFIALSHDLLKEHGLDPSKDGTIVWKDEHNIPQDLNRYVRTNLDILEEWDLADFFNTDIQLHALASGIFLIKEFGIEDPEVIYPIFFHSCPITSVYETLSDRTKELVDIIMLADKLSSNYLRINEKNTGVRVDLDKVVFGESGKEFNYSTGLYVARLISQGKNPDEQSLMTTDLYYKRVQAINPLIRKNTGIKKLGGISLWPKRKSKVLPMQ